MTPLERFQEIDLVRRSCDAQETTYQFDGAFTRENIAWIFSKARLQILREQQHGDEEEAGERDRS